MIPGSSKKLTLRHEVLDHRLMMAGDVFDGPVVYTAPEDFIGPLVDVRVDVALDEGIAMGEQEGEFGADLEDGNLPFRVEWSAAGLVLHLPEEIVESFPGEHEIGVVLEHPELGVWEFSGVATSVSDGTIVVETDEPVDFDFNVAGTTLSIYSLEGEVAADSWSGCVRDPKLRPWDKAQKMCWCFANSVPTTSLIQAGDANADLVFDQRDIVQLLQEGRYLSDESAEFYQGDFNGDGVFDQLDIITAMQTGNYLNGPYAEQLVDDGVIDELSSAADTPNQGARRPIVKDVDTNGDGVPDKRYVDWDGDGDADTVLENPDNDRNPDGKPNWDSGRTDVDRGDSDGDGQDDYDHEWDDANNNGKADPGEVKPLRPLETVLPMP